MKQTRHIEYNAMSIQPFSKYFYEIFSHLLLSCVVNSYGLNGRGKQALNLYHRTPKKLVNEITHICILNACSHSGLIDDTYRISQKISQKTAKICSTMVNRV